MNKEEEQIIINLYLSGLSAQKVANKVNRSKNGVLYVLNKNNINTSNRKYDLRRHSVNDDFFNTIDCQEKAYILGLLMADGNVLDDYTIQITLQIRDEHILQKISELIESTYPLYYSKNKKYCTLRFMSKKITQDLAKYNIVPRKSLILEPPNIPSHLYRHLVRGYFDGDGSIYLDKKINQYRIHFVGTKSVLSDFIDKMNWRKHKIRRAKKNNVFTFRLEYGGNILVSNMLNTLYKDSTIHFKRKYEKYLDCLRLKEEKEQTKKQIWMNNLGSYIRNDI